MKKNLSSILVLLLIAVLLCSCSSKLTGKWHDAQNNVTLELSSDGKLSFSSPVIAYEGSYSVKGDVLTITANDQASVLHFSVEKNTLSLTDVNENISTFEKVK